jgi:hypothetical protein
MDKKFIIIDDKGEVVTEDDYPYWYIGTDGLVYIETEDIDMPMQEMEGYTFRQIGKEECEVVDLVDKIARFFEKDDNWKYLKRDCWLMNGYSTELRRMLYEAIKE